MRVHSYKARTGTRILEIDYHNNGRQQQSFILDYDKKSDFARHA